MKNLRRLGITLLALSMGMGSLASAQERDRGQPDRNNGHKIERHGPPDRNDRNKDAKRWDKRNPHSAQQQQHADNGRSRDNQGYNQRGEWRDRNGEWRGAGPSHNFRRGTYLTPQYRSRQYVVDDWRGHHLKAPPRGYHWVQTGGDYVLVAIATGLILEILLNY